MSEFLRSMEMKYVSVQVTNEAAHATMKALGEFAHLHMIDLSNKEVPTKQYLYYKKRLAKALFWQNKLLAFQDHMKTFDVDTPDYEPLDHHYNDVLQELKEYLEPKEADLLRNISFMKDNAKQISALIERSHVVEFAKHGLDIQQRVAELERKLDEKKHSRTRGELLNQPLLVEMEEHTRDMKGQEDRKFQNYITGVLDLNDKERFKRMLYRVSPVSFVNFYDIEEPLEDPLTSELSHKTVFYVVVLGELLYKKVERMCNVVFNAHIYPIPDADSPHLFDRTLNAIRTEIADKKEIAEKTREAIVLLLRGMAAVAHTSPVRDWLHAIHKEKLTCDAFMKCHFTGRAVTFLEGWVPAQRILEFKSCLQDAVRGTDLMPASYEVDPRHPIVPPGSPPTAFPKNKFTSIFQSIVDTYGVPRYQEINPGLFTIITFPFLFGVMYGDLGHGSALTIVALLMIWKENSLKKNPPFGEIGRMVFTGRYLLLLMGCFAVYCGSLYNDFFSIPLVVYDRTWNLEKVLNDKGVEVEQYVHTDSTYPWGVDPTWYGKPNELAFFNSMKMKMSVILGVSHMLFGVILSLFNHIYFGNWVSVYFEFIPQFLFLFCTFGYMDFLILLKWTMDWDDSLADERGGPNLIQTMIKMFLSPGKVPSEDQLYSGQAAIQVIFLIVALVSVPVMLFGKPCILRYRHRNQNNPDHGMYDQLDTANSPRSDDDHLGVSDLDFDVEHGDEKEADFSGFGSEGGLSQGGGHGHGHGHGHGEFNYGDEQIHQGIHTIEFVLGCVSNTASYLRLWALSLAHAQLSSVFWDKMIMTYGIEKENPVAIVMGVAVWAMSSTMVLLMMDALECFLHALRLHWVEFQNKFYYADGYKFEPFNFSEDSDDDE